MNNEKMVDRNIKTRSRFDIRWMGPGNISGNIRFPGQTVESDLVEFDKVLSRINNGGMAIVDCQETPGKVMSFEI